MRVAAGAVAKKFLAKECGIEVYGYLSELGPIKIESVDRDRNRTQSLLLSRRKQSRRNGGLHGSAE